MNIIINGFDVHYSIVNHYYSIVGLIVNVIIQAPRFFVAFPEI